MPRSRTPRAVIELNLVDGTRRPLAGSVRVFVRVLDGDQKQVVSRFLRGSSIRIRNLRFHDNLRDRHTVIVSAKGFVQAGFTPVKIHPERPKQVSLMLIPRNAGFNFSQAHWDALNESHPMLHTILRAGARSNRAAQDRYEELMENGAPSLAALLNITTAMASLHLPLGTPLNYYKTLVWKGEEAPRPDRFFGFCDRRLLVQIEAATEAGVFRRQVGAGFFHAGATRAYKEVRFGEANVHLTFHEKDRRTIGRVSCMKVEADMDYFQDPLAHALLEVIPNELIGVKTDPRRVYALRWIAGRQAGVPEFNPPYTLVGVPR